jgi:hypothetical protein
LALKANLEVALPVEFIEKLLTETAFHRLDIAGGNAHGGVVIAHLRSAGTLGLQMGEAGFAAFQFAAASRCHTLGSSFVRFEFAHRKFPRKGSILPL